MVTKQTYIIYHKDICNTLHYQEAFIKKNLVYVVFVNIMYFVLLK